MKLSTISLPLYPLLLALAGCPLADGEESIRVLWPEEPVPALEAGGIAGWEVRWYASDGTVSRRRAAGAQILLTVQKELPLLLSARPVPASNLAPWQPGSAGIVLPVHRPRPEEIRLSWKGGFAADCLLDLAERGVPPRKINLSRFTQTAAKRSDGEPWNLDRRRLLADLIAGKLRYYSFRLRKRREVSVGLPSGRWYPAHPLEGALVANQRGWTGNLTEGLHYFVNPADRLAASVSVNRDAAAQLLLEALGD